MKFEQEYRKANPETVGETDREFDLSNYVEWLESLVEEKFTSTNIAMDAIPAFVSTFIDEHMFGMREREALQYFGRWSQEQHQ